MLFRTLQSFANEALDAIPSETGHAAIHRRFLPFGLQPDLPWLHETPVLLGAPTQTGAPYPATRSLCFPVDGMLVSTAVPRRSASVSHLSF